MVKILGFGSKSGTKVSASDPSFWGIEDELSLVNMLCIRKGGRDVWAVVNNEGPITQFVFIWDFEPFHETAITDKAMSGLLSLSMETDGQEQFTVSAYSNADCSRRVNQLRQEAKNSSPAIEFFYESEVNRIEELSATRLRKNLRYTVSNTYTINPEEKDAADGIEKALLHIRKFWARLVEPNNEEEDENLLDLIQNVLEAWQDYDTKLAAKLGIPSRSHNGEEIWRDQWIRFNGNYPDPGLPYYLFVDLDAREYREIGRDGKTIAPGQKFVLPTYLIGDQQVPLPSRDRLYLPNRREHVAVLGFTDIPDGWDDEEPNDKYKWLWDTLLSVDGISDIELHSQLCWVDQKGTLKNLYAVTKQNLTVEKDAKDRGSIDKMAELTAREGNEGLEMMMTNDRPIFVGVAIIVYANSEERLKTNIRRIKARFTQPAEVYQEPNYAWKIWLQTSPFRMEPIFTSRDYNIVPNDYRQKPNISAALGLVPGIGIRNVCHDGLEFISRNGSIPVNLAFEDADGNPWHGTIYGGTGSGKSVVSSRFIDYADARRFVTSMIDSPDGKAKGSYSYKTKFLGGAEIDTGKTKNNLLEYIDVSHLDPETARDRLSQFHTSCELAINSLILDNLPSAADIPLTQVQSLLPRAVRQFFQDETIRKRIDAALKSHPGTQDWLGWPTLKDFLGVNPVCQSDGFITTSRLNEDNDDANERAINFIRTRIRFWLETSLSQTIAEPSDYDLRQHRLVLFSLRDIGSDQEAAVIGLAATQASERRSLGASRSLFYVDELHKWLKYPSLATYIGEDYATARKKGKNILIATQTPNVIDECVASASILQNTSYSLIGKIKQNAVPSFERILGLPPELLAANVGTSTNSRQRSSPWLAVIDGLATHVNFFAADIPLASVLTNTGQINLRNQYLERYSNPYEALARFAADCRERMITGSGFKDMEIDY